MNAMRRSMGIELPCVEEGYRSMFWPPMAEAHEEPDASLVHADSGDAPSATVRACSRRNCWTYHGPRAPLPLEPLAPQPVNGWTPGQAPLVAPARRFT